MQNNCIGLIHNTPINILDFAHNRKQKCQVFLDLISEDAILLDFLGTHFLLLVSIKTTLYTIQPEKADFLR